MDCKEVVKKMYLYLDREILTEEERKELEEHLRLCRKCCQRYEFEQQLWSFIRKNSLEDSIPETLLTRIEQVIAQF